MFAIKTKYVKISDNTIHSNIEIFNTYYFKSKLIIYKIMEYKISTYYTFFF